MNGTAIQSTSRTHRLARVCILTSVLALVLVAAGVGSFVTAAHATVLMRLTPKQLSTQAHSIVIAKAVAGKSHWQASQGRAKADIETDITFQVQRVIKGEPSLRKTVVVPGGVMGDTIFRVRDTPNFAKGQKYLLFLDEDNGVLGWQQGSLAIRNGRVLAWDLTVDQAIGRIDHLLGRSVSIRSKSPMLSSSSGALTGASSLRLGALGSAIPRLPLVPTGNLRASQLIALSEDFETSMGDLTVLEGDPTWGRSSSRSAAGSWSAYCNETGTGSTYPDNIDAWMLGGPWDFSTITAGTLDFDIYLDSATDDVFACLFTIDGQSFYGGVMGDGQLDWGHVSIDLDNLDLMSGGTGSVCGESFVAVYFIFQGNGDGSVGEGAYIDNVEMLVEDGGSSGNVVLSSISPTSASAGTSTDVTLTGSGFGSTKGSVNFFFQGTETIPANTIDSWTDTRIVCEVPEDHDGYFRSAGSGPVTVSTAGGDESNSVNFSVPFGVEAYWATDGTSYYINENCPGTSVERQQMQNAADEWSPASTSWQYTYAGSCTATDWVQNGKNEMSWANLGTDVISASGEWIKGQTIGGCITWPQPVGNVTELYVINEMDIVFNDQFAWGDASVNSSVMDIWSIAVHEMGHGLILLDLYGDADSDKIMYGYGSEGQLKRYLTAGDEAGVAWIYPASQTKPTITSLSPTSGEAGSQVTITGSHFGSSGTVKFNTTAATTSTWTDGSIVATVPASLADGTYSVTVTNSNGTSNGMNFQVTSVTLPSISSLSPTSGVAGSQVTIIGSHFGTSGTVKFNTTAATTSTWTDGAIIATVPSVSNGTYSVTVTTGAGTSNGMNFQVSGTPGHVPTTTIRSDSEITGWHNHDVSVWFDVTDSAGDESILLYTWDHVTWEELDLAKYSGILFSADQGWEGDTEVFCKAKDAAGNVEATEHSFHVRIDVHKPSTKAPSRAAVRRGRTATLKFSVSDPEPNGGTAKVLIKIKNRSGRVVKTIKFASKPVNTALTARFRCKLPRGTYKFLVYATDTAGNKQSKVGYNRLVVR